MDEIYLDNIDEYVNDHDKIVTYKWLSLTLGVHVNTAKQMLFHYLDHKRKESSAQLHATYLVSGKFVDNGLKSHKVSLVREDQLENVKSKMSPVVSVHIYSVQKALLKDSGPLYSVDYDAVKDNMKNCSRYSAIRCSSAVPLSPVEMQREIQREPTPEPDIKKSSVNGNAVAKVSSKPQKGIMGMFGTKPASKNQDESKDVKSEVKENTPVVEDKPAAKTSHMKNFFGNQTKKADKTVKEEEAARPPAADPKPQKEEKPPREPVAAAEPPKQTKKDSRSKSKRVQDSDSEEEKTEKKNKRRRIKKPVSDSSDEDVIPDSPQPTEPTRGSTPSPKKQIQPITQSNVNSEGKIRRRRRVLKAKTFVDDEGCIVTEKAYESESYSEEDAPAPAVRTTALSSRPSGRDPEKKNQKKIAANKGGKQASIMGFFQKK